MIMIIVHFTIKTKNTKNIQPNQLNEKIFKLNDYYF